MPQASAEQKILLKAARKGCPQTVEGGKVVVFGGGNVAYDCARTAVRLGAASVDVCCPEWEVLSPALGTVSRSC